MTNASFDFVHDLQGAFRQVLHCHAFPGQQASIAPHAALITHQSPLSPTLEVLALMLLDAETNFYLAESDGNQGTYLSHLCYARLAPVAQAHFIIIPGMASPSVVAQLISEANRGTLEDPHQAATIILECPSVAAGVLRTLQGPGIQGTRSYPLALAAEVLAARQQSTREFPLGVDLIIFDAHGQVQALPRSTRIEVA